MTPSLDRDDPMLVFEPASRCVEVGNTDDHMVDNQSHGWMMPGKAIDLAW
jgi:hypothetical protein